MKRIYFDTNIYSQESRNNILDNEILTAKRKNQIQIILGVNNIEELLANSDKNKVKSDLEFAFELVDKKIIFKALPEIILGEVLFVLKKVRCKPFYTGNEAKQYFDTIKLLSQNSVGFQVFN